MSISKGKIFSFAIITLGGGLLQLWILCFMKFQSEHMLNPSQILGDGALYFFSTSLAFSSFVTLSSFAPIKFGGIHFNCTLLLVMPLTFWSVVDYVSILSKSTKELYPFSNHLTPQICCVIAALVYAFYVCLVTGLFEESQDV